MTYISNFIDFDIQNTCRICLTQSDNMISLNSKLDGKLESPIILEALENILSMKVIAEEKYPEQVCKMCHGNIKISYDLKIIYKKSQNILQKYRSLYDTEDLKNSSETFDSPTDANMKTVILNLNDTTEKNKNINVKWLEGNKFIIEDSSTNILKPLISCASCHKKFVSKERLTAHLNVCKKLTSNLIQCDFCDYKFTSLPRKDYHVKMKHMSKVAECEICNKFFKNNRALSYHNTTQHNSEGKKFICKICSKGFFLKNGLDQHMDIHSRDVSKVICPICGKGFHYRGGLFYHMKMHRNERNYNCSYCGRKFLNVSGLKKHIRTHTGERPYTCTFCRRSFLSKNILDNHEKTHTGVKSKFCPYCEKGFITAYSLKVHISSHVGSIPCGLCRRSFLNNDVLKLHMKFKHNVIDTMTT